MPDRGEATRRRRNAPKDGQARQKVFAPLTARRSVNHEIKLSGYRTASRIEDGRVRMLRRYRGKRVIFPGRVGTDFTGRVERAATAARPRGFALCIGPA